MEYVGKHAKKQHKRHGYQTDRYTPGEWNGLSCGHYRAQYFYKDSADRMAAMFEIAMLLHDVGIRFQITIWKDYFRLMISGRDYGEMPRAVYDMIREINMHYFTTNW